MVKKKQTKKLFLYYYETRNCQLSGFKQDQDIRPVEPRVQKLQPFNFGYVTIVVKGLKKE